jgi:hypothetical protein
MRQCVSNQPLHGLISNRALQLQNGMYGITFRAGRLA